MADGERFVSAIEALRARGAQQVDPVRFRFIESLAERAARHEGAARRVLDERLAQRLSAHELKLDQGAQPQDNARPPAGTDPLPRSALADLVADLGGRSTQTAPVSTAQAKTKTAAIDSSVELETLPFFRRTWSRLSADQRLAQSQAALPDNAGPLNSHHLVHRSLTLMRELSPGYFDRFVAHVDALLSLQQRKG
jgi:hypothetical protein